MVCQENFCLPRFFYQRGGIWYLMKSTGWFNRLSVWTGLHGRSAQRPSGDFKTAEPNPVDLYQQQTAAMPKPESPKKIRPDAESRNGAFWHAGPFIPAESRLFLAQFLSAALKRSRTARIRFPPARTGLGDLEFKAAGIASKYVAFFHVSTICHLDALL